MRTRGWTKEQDEMLIGFCKGSEIHIKDMSKIIGKSERAMYDRMKELGIKRQGYKWTDEQDEIVRSLYPVTELPISFIADKVNKTERAVRIRAKKLKVKRYDNDSIHEYILNNYGKDGVTAQSIADKFNRPVGTVYRMALELGKARKQEFDQITTGQIKNIVQRYAKENTYKLSAELGLPDYTIRKAAAKNGIKKVVTKKTAKPRKTHKWTAEQETFILNKHESTTMQEIANELKLPYNCVKGKISTMGLSDKNLKIYKTGGISFKYNTGYEKQKKLEYAIMVRNLINESRIGDVYR